uniref:Uncharacterized protein n=1 Tax=Acrobeloides nanus TaxID=290746 RepID=A0A914E7N8_9BILA
MYRAFNDEGRYHRFDLNMPTKLLRRDGEDYLLDSPITRTGIFVAERVGYALKVNKTLPDVIYTSPSLRCIQTATAVSRGMGRPDIQLRIEPGLSQKTWLHDRIPLFMSPNELEEQGFNIDTSYVPILRRHGLCEKGETMKSYSYRVHRTLGQILRRRENARTDQTVLLVGHATTVDLAAGYFMDRIGTKNNYKRFVPYCAFVSFERRYDGWMRTNMLPPMTYNGFCSQLDF